MKRAERRHPGGRYAGFQPAWSLDIRTQRVIRSRVVGKRK